MPKIKLQNRSPPKARIRNRQTRPSPPDIARARAVSHLGRSRCRSGGSGSGATAITPVGVGFSRSGIEDFHQVARRILAGELEEDLRGAAAVVRLRAQLVHRA